jgi:hypothetical protein
MPTKPDLARRYVDKALERLRCMYCHKPLTDDEPYHAYFKGFHHDECRRLYHGRGGYLRQQASSSDQ